MSKEEAALMEAILALLARYPLHMQKTPIETVLWHVESQLQAQLN